MIRIVCHKKMDMTDDEWSMYQKIVASYTKGPNKGEDLFIDLFETDEYGQIIFLKPPSQRHTSLEVFLFLMSIMQHQTLRRLNTEAQLVFQQFKNKITELEDKIKLLEK